MNILFVATVYNHLSAFHKPFINYFQSKGYTVHAAGSNFMGRKNELEEMGVICHDISFNKNPISKDNIKAIKSLKNLFKSIQFQLIHVHTPIAAFLTRFVLRKFNNGKILYTAHGFHFFKGAALKNWVIFYSAEKIASKWTDGIIVMNQEDLNLAQKIGFKKDENLFFVNGVGVDLEQFNKNVSTKSSIRNELNLNEKDKIISCIAELSIRKNQIFLLENWKQILKDNPNTHLVLVGDGSEKETLESYIKSNNLNNIHLLGFRNDVSEIITESDIITLVSKHEGLPKCLMEAMACGKPIIASNVRGSNDLVNHGESGFLVNLHDNEKIIYYFNKLISNESLRKEFGKVGNKKIQEYSLKNVLNQMNLIYSKYLKELKR